MSVNQYDTIVIGAGHNGLVTAGYLAKEGLSVLVLERQDIVGGACVTEEIYPGFAVPYCAYICYMLQGKVIDDLELRNHGLELIPTEYGSFHPFPDGRYLQLGARANKWDRFEGTVGLSEQDARAYTEWAAFWTRASGILYRYWLQDPPTLAQVFDDVRGSRDEEVLETILTVSMRDFLDRYFDSDHLKSYLVHAGATGDPSAPGSLLRVAYFLCSTFSRPEDVGIPRGSMGAITQAMARSAQARGVEIRTGSLVENVIVEAGVAQGVRLANGEELKSFIVVSNADPMRTYLNMVDPEHLDGEFISQVKRLVTRGTIPLKFLAALKDLPDFSGYLGRDYDPRRAAEITICPSVDYYEQSWHDAMNGRATNCPMMSVQIPSLYDSSLAPSGHHVLSNSVLYYPAKLKNGSWQNVGNDVGEQIIDMLTEYAPNFRDCIIDWIVQTPEDIETREGMTDGNVHHIDTIPEQMFSRRMPYRSPIERLYMCGSSTHPGGEVTGAPGYNAARAILKDLEKAV